MLEIEIINLRIFKKINEDEYIILRNTNIGNPPIKLYASEKEFEVITKNISLDDFIKGTITIKRS